MSDYQERPSVVYFLRIIPNGLIKIGRTGGDVYFRVTALQKASPYELEWIGHIPETEDENETTLHRKFCIHRFRGEWFYPDPAILRFINAKCPDFCAQKARDEMFFEPCLRVVRRWLHPKHKGRDKKRWHLADAVGVDVYFIHAWLDYRQMPTEEMALKAAAFALEAEVAA